MNENREIKKKKEETTLSYLQRSNPLQNPKTKLNGPSQSQIKI